jgi:plastocyanin
MKRGVGFVLVGLALIAASCSSGPKGAQSYSIQADASSGAGKHFQFAAFYPSVIKARPGDTITIVNGGPGAPHTVSFGVKPDHSNSPPVATPAGENPAVFKACVTPQAPSPKMVSSPAQYAKPAEYTGSGYWNYFMVPAGSPPQAGPTTTTLKLSSSIAPGTYHFLCILHAPMQGTLEVVSKDSDRKTPADVTAEVKTAVASAQADGDKIPNPAVSASVAAAGWGSGNIAVNRFYPLNLSVKAGTKVTWKTFSAFEPHTVTFGAKRGAPGTEGAFFAPSGVKSGGSYTGGLANSGIYGAVFPGPKEFSLIFTQPGKYTYVCQLHEGMDGTVTVT